MQCMTGRTTWPVSALGKNAGREWCGGWQGSRSSLACTAAHARTCQLLGECSTSSSGGWLRQDPFDLYVQDHGILVLRGSAAAGASSGTRAGRQGPNLAHRKQAPRLTPLPPPCPTHSAPLSPEGSFPSHSGGGGSGTGSQKVRTAGASPGERHPDWTLSYPSPVHHLERRPVRRPVPRPGADLPVCCNISLFQLRPLDPRKKKNILQ